MYSADEHYAVVSNGDMTVTVQPGIAWLKADTYWGVQAFEVNPTVLTIETAHGSLPRIDSILISLDKNQNLASIIVKKGEYSPQPPAAPVPVRDLDYDQICIATIYVAAGATSITTSAITDKRLDESVCGIMSDGVTKIPTQMLYDQFMSAVGDMLDAAHDALSGDVAGNLLNLINARVTIASIINALTSDDTTVPLSAAQGKALKALIDDLSTNLIDQINTLSTAAVKHNVAQSLTSTQKSQARTNIGAWEPPTLLWTNASPGSTFAAQSIGGAWSAYTSFIVEYSVHIAQVGHRCTVLIPKGVEMSPSHYLGAFASNYWRYIVINDGGVYFYDGYYRADGGAATVDNMKMIPYKIWGIKEMTL